MRCWGGAGPAPSRHGPRELLGAGQPPLVCVLPILLQRQLGHAGPVAIVPCSFIGAAAQFWFLQGGSAAQQWSSAHLSPILWKRGGGTALVASMQLPAGPGCDIWLELQGHQDCGALSLQLILLGHKFHLLKHLIN